ncbi:hypothetical protein ACFUAG_06960 [Streptomyces sp. NPDC057193]
MVIEHFILLLDAVSAEEFAAGVEGPDVVVSAEKISSPGFNPSN